MTVERNLKNRLVGVAVLLGSAALVLPWVLDGANRKALLADTRMPTSPPVPEAGALLAAPPAAMPAAEADIDRAHAPAEPETVPPVAVAPAPTAAAPMAAAPITVPAAATPSAASAASSPAVSATAPPPPVATAASPDARLAALAEAWDVQVAASSAQEGADRLRDRLVAAGYKARVARVNGLYKVYVGPTLRRDDAEQLRTRLAADARVGKPKGMLVRYVP